MGTTRRAAQAPSSLLPPRVSSREVLPAAFLFLNKAYILSQPDCTYMDTLTIEGIKVRLTGLQLREQFNSLAGKADEKAAERRDTAELSKREKIKEYKTAEAEEIEKLAKGYREFAERIRAEDTYLLTMQDLAGLELIEQPDFDRLRRLVQTQEGGHAAPPGVDTA